MNLLNLSRSSKHSQHKTSWSCSRYLDNHYNTKLHSSPFLPNNFMNEPKHMVYTDIGLSEVRTQSSKLKNYKNLEAVNSSVVSMNQSEWRPFPEQSSQDPLITIEYCTNCQQHQQTTRHKEEQYYNTAVMLKQLIILNYPDIKVYLKPLLFEQNRSVENIFLQRRIGAFEVQLKLGQEKILLFSKLKSKTWPDLNQIIKKMHSHFKKTNFLIQLEYEDKDTNLNNIQVTLSLIINNTRSKSFSIKERPTSSIQNRSTKSSSFHKSHCTQQQQSGTVYTEKSDSQGRVLFMNVPIDRFEMSIKETQNHLPVFEQINIQDLMLGDGAVHKVILRKPEFGNLKIEIFYDSTSDQSSQIKSPCSDVSVNLIYKDAVIKVKEISCNSGIYECQSLQIGQYQLTLQKSGFKTVQEFVQIKGGINAFKYILVQGQGSITQSFLQELICSQIHTKIAPTKSKIRPPTATNMRIMTLLDVGMITVKDEYDQEPINGVRIKLLDVTTNKVISCLTNSSGSTKLLLANVSSGIINCSKSGYFDKHIEYGIGKEIDLKTSKNLNLELFKIPEFITILSESQVYILQGHRMINLENNRNRYQLKGQGVIFISLNEEWMQEITILTKNQIQNIKCPKCCNIQTFPQIWILGYLKNDQFEQINIIQSTQMFNNFPNYMYSQKSQIKQTLDTIHDYVFDRQFILLLQQGQVKEILKEGVELKPNIRQNALTITAINDNMILVSDPQNISIYLCKNMVAEIILDKQCSICLYCEITISLVIGEYIYIGRNDGIIIIYDYQLKQQLIQQISEDSIQTIINTNENNFIFSTNTEIIICDKQQNNNYFTYLNRFNIQQTMLNIRIIDTQLEVIVKDQLLIFEDIYQQRQKLTNQFKQYDLTQSSYLVVQNFKPILYYLDKCEIDDIHQDGNLWITKLNPHRSKPILLILQGDKQFSNTKITIYTQYTNYNIFQGNYPRAPTGYWHIGILINQNEVYQLQTLINKVYLQIQYQPIICESSNTIGCYLDNQQILYYKNNKLISLNVDNLKEKVYCEIASVTLIKAMDDYLLIAQGNIIFIYKKELTNHYSKLKEIDCFQKNILDMTIVSINDNGNQAVLLVSSEDLKLSMLSLNNYQIEYQQIVDRSLINYIVPFKKNQFITSYSDGRLRVWKRERSTKGASFVQMRTAQTVKVVRILQIPWDESNILVAGEGDGILCLYNVDSCRQVKSFPKNHAQQIIALSCVCNQTIISGCNAGLIVFWDYTSGQQQGMINSLNIGQLIRTNQSLVVMGNRLEVYHY